VAVEQRVDTRHDRRSNLDDLQAHQISAEPAKSGGPVGIVQLADPTSSGQRG
jgi:hypothetical protein